MNTLITSLAAVVIALGWPQDNPTEIAKSELPKNAVVTFCGTDGATEVERPNFGFRYKGKAYYFCDKAAVEAFKKDPEGFLPLPVPRPAPKFTVKTLTGEEVTLESYKGKVVLVDFWATWCKPCIETMPEVQKLHEKYGRKGLAVAGISIDQDGEKKVKPFIEKRKFAYPILLDGGKSPAWQAFRVKGVPALFLIDRQGRIVKEWRGKPDKKEVDEAVAGLLE